MPCLNDNFPTFTCSNMHVLSRRVCCRICIMQLELLLKNSEVGMHFYWSILNILILTNTTEDVISNFAAVI